MGAAGIEATSIAVTAAATLVLAVATAVFAVVAWRQLRVLQDTQEDTARSAAAAQTAAVAAEVTAKSAEEHSRIARDQVQIALAQTELTQSAQEERSILATVPLLACSVDHDGEKASLTFANVGATPAHDVSLWILGFWPEEEWPLEEFLEQFVGDSDAVEDFAADDEGFYALRDHLYYMQVPPGSSVTAPLFFPVLPFTITLLQQSRDILGRNYLRAYWFMQDQDRYALGSTDPFDHGLGPRIDSPEFESLEPDGLPDWLGNELRSWLPAALSVGFVKGGAAQWEDRGVWRYG